MGQVVWHPAASIFSDAGAELALAGDELLTVADLMGSDTSIGLASLSACDSGRGRVTASGDLIRLTRALIAAGAQELIVSLWPVDDELACLPMVALHERLLAGLRPADALVGDPARDQGVEPSGGGPRLRGAADSHRHHRRG
jgi:CHAT domain-containing protein